MSYKSIISKEANTVQDAGIATKILQHLDRIRNNKSEASARRWVWELIQNAKDVSYTDRPVSIKIELFQNCLKFSHNGKPFKIKNVLSIINQISSKTDNKESTGMFGTGFITTHQLSEIVELEGLVHDYYMNSDLVKTHLPYKKFKITLDRSGKNITDITSSVKKSLDVIRKLDDLPDILEDDRGFNTCLSYDLKTQYSKDIAKKGIIDLKYSVMYSLIFVEGISGIEIIDYTDNSRTIYKKENAIYLDNSIYKYSLSCNQTYYSYLLAKSNKGTSIAVPLSEENNFCQIDKNTPKLYVDFPLLGSELFPLPYIVQNSQMYPHEKRDWIPISANDTQQSNTNKEILLESVNLFEKIVKYSLENSISNLHNIVQLFKIAERSDLDSEWFVNNIHLKIISIFKNYPIFHYNDEAICLGDGYSLAYSSSSTDEAIYVCQALSLIKNYKVVDFSDVKLWNDLILDLPEDYRTYFNCIDLNHIHENILYKITKDDLVEDNYINFVQKVYTAMMLNEEYLKKIKSNQINIFPNMQNPPKLLPIEDIVNSQNITDEYIDIFEKLDLKEYYRYSHATFRKFGVKDELLHREFVLPENSGVKGRALRYYYDNIKRIYNFFCEYKLNMMAQFEFDKINLLILCVRGETEFLKVLEAFTYGDISTYTKSLKCENIVNGDDEFFFEFYKYNIRKIGKYISNFSNIETLKVKCNLSNAEVYENLNLYMAIAHKRFMLGVLCDYKVFLNRNNNFISDIEAQKNAGILSEFIEISNSLEFIPANEHNYVNCNSYLLNDNLNYPGTMSTCDNKDICSNISRSIDVLLSHGELRMQADIHQEACAMLLAWINDNPEKAQELFPNYASEESRMRLLSSKTASIINRNLNAYKNALAEIGINSPEDLKEAIDNNNLVLSKNSTNFFEENDDYSNVDVFEDEYFSQLKNTSERCLYISKIGNRGELIAYDLLIEKYTALGFEVLSKDENCCKLEKLSENITIDKPDTEVYKQAGWDICVTYSNEEQKATDYYEIKTSTSTTYDNYVKFSNAQFNMALSVQKNYHLFSVYLKPESLDFVKYYITEALFDGFASPKIDLNFKQLTIRVKNSVN